MATRHLVDLDSSVARVKTGKADQGLVILAAAAVVLPRADLNPQRYHFTDATCDINDPNAPFFDPATSIYHLMYQDHLHAPVRADAPGGPGGGPVWGHAVSRDLVRWHRMPVAVWNGPGWSDLRAIFTGSATVSPELGGPALVFPGVCDGYPPHGVPGCKYGYTFGLAVPANGSDPLLTNWTKRPGGPIANDTFDDPSTAWRTRWGEWRFVGNCGDGKVGDCGPDPKFRAAPIWASADNFITWRKVGFTNLPAGECSSLYPLPPLVPGAPPLPPGTAAPTHVFKWGCGTAADWTRDCYTVGRWIDGYGDDPGRWEPGSGPTSPPLMDRGIYYASKDFWDGTRGRRIVWGWAPLFTNSFALPREVQYDPRFGRLTFSPLAEQAQLRNGTISSAHSTPLSTPVRLAATQQCEALLVFALPPAGAAAVFGVNVTLEGLEAPVVRTHIVIPADRTGGRSQTHRSIRVVGESTAAPPNDPPFTGSWSFDDEFPLMRSEETVVVRFFLDHTIAEVYWGVSPSTSRIAMTLPLQLAGASVRPTIIAFSDGGRASLAGAEVWAVGPMWSERMEL